jgi:peptidoglycan/xylan/chitin deacetylase (PgdA/CDA1 family)
MPIDRRCFLTGVLAVGGLTLTGCRAGDDTRPAVGASAATTTPPAPSVPQSSLPATSTITTPPTTAFSGVARYVARGATGATTTRAALTFHTEGTVAQVGRLLDLAAALEVPLTLLIVGRWLESNVELGRRIAVAGHDLGNHTYSHLALPSQTRAVVASEIERGAAVMANVLGTRGRWFRPSGSNSTTDVINEEAGKAGYPVVLGFDTDPLDYQDPGAVVVRSRVLETTRDGALVSLHAQHQGTIDAFESIVQGLRAKGITLVRASDLVR